MMKGIYLIIGFFSVFINIVILIVAIAEKYYIIIPISAFGILASCSYITLSSLMQTTEDHEKKIKIMEEYLIKNTNFSPEIIKTEKRIFDFNINDLISNDETDENLLKVKEYFNARKFNEAYTLLSTISYSKNPDVHALLGYCHFFGYGTEKDPKAAINWFKYSSDKGSSVGMLLYGIIMYDGELIKGWQKDGIDLIHKSAELGNPKAKEFIEINNI